MDILLEPLLGLLIGAVCVACSARVLSSTRYVCPACGKTFRSRWWKAFLAFHVGDDIALRCLHCGKKSVCYPSHDQSGEG
ncbi:MAG: hypothetical protein IJX53_06280 [Clostridia bacterium]|nr:hypothetical protein [Clostridia bacterium]